MALSIPVSTPFTPRKMLPPPITIAISMFCLCISNISLARELILSPSIQYSPSPASASPESFIKIRLKGLFLLAGSSSTDLVPRKLAHGNIFSKFGYKFLDQLSDNLFVVLDMNLLQKTNFCIEAG